MSHTARYSLVITLVIATFTLELIGTLRTNSIGLLSDALHLAADSVPLFLGLIAVRLRTLGRKTSALEHWTTYCNIALLLVTAVWIGHETFERVVSPQHVDAAMLFFAIGGCIGNGAQYYFTRGLADAHHHAHVGKGQIWHLATDFLASFGVFVGATVLYLTGSLYADIGAAALIVVITIIGAIHLWREMHHHNH